MAGRTSWIASAVVSAARAPVEWPTRTVTLPSGCASTHCAAAYPMAWMEARVVSGVPEPKPGRSSTVQRSPSAATAITRGIRRRTSARGRQTCCAHALVTGCWSSVTQSAWSSDSART